jgi:hypothetical protein
MVEYIRDAGFGDKPHIYDENWDENGFMASMGFVKELCPVCKAHLRPTDSGTLICLNACHFSKSLKESFVQAMIESEKRVREQNEINSEN